MNDGADGHYERGNALLDSGQFDAAIDAYDQAIAQRPGFAAALNNRAVALAGLDRRAEALAGFDAALAAAPHDPDSHHLRGHVLRAWGRPEDALASYGLAIGLAPEDFRLHNSRGSLLAGLGHHEAALASFRRACALNPDFAEGHSNLGNVLAATQRREEALQCYDRAIALDPALADASYNRGIALAGLGRVDAAILSYDRAIGIREDFAEAWCNRGLLLQGRNRLGAARRDFDRAIALRPGFAEAHVNRAFGRLLDGDFAAAWDDFEWRLDTGTGAAERARFSAPRWHGSEPLAGSRILIYAEQGLGDSIHFCRYVPLVASRGAHVILEVPAALVPLLRALDGAVELVARGSDLPPIDYQCPLMSLPRAFGTTLETVPCAPAYLRADPAKVARWKSELDAIPGPRIGLAWSGSTLHANDHLRSISLQALAASLPGECRFVAVQAEVRESDREALASSHDIIDVAGRLRDFGDTAALCACLDLVVSVDTSVAHLACALGLSTWILLPFHPDWRWMLDRETSPWYPTAKLYRQSQVGDWSGVLQRLHADLAGFVRTRTGGA